MILLTCVLTLGCDQTLAQNVHLYSRPLAEPIRIANDSIWSIEVHGKIDNRHHGSGQLIWRLTRPVFTDFGDATFDANDKAIVKDVKFRPLGIPPNRRRRIYEVVGSDVVLMHRFRLVLSEDAKEDNRLLVFGKSTPPVKERGDVMNQPPIERRLVMYRTLDPKPPVSMARPTHGKLYLRSEHQVGKGHYEIQGEIGAPIGVTLDRNGVTLNQFGDETSRTLVLHYPARVDLRELKTVDPLGQGRRLFLLDPMAETTAQQYLVLSLHDGGPHRLIVRRGERLVNVLPLFDPIRKRYLLEMASKYDSISADETAVLTQIIKIIGYDWSWKSDSGHVVVLNLHHEVGVSEVLPQIAKLRFLQTVYLSGYGVSDEAALQLRELDHLRTLNLRRTLLLRSTVDQLQKNPGLHVIPPELSTVPEERAVVSDLLHGGIRLQADNRGHIISASDAYGQLVMPMPPQEIIRKLAALQMLRSLDCTEMGIGTANLLQLGQLTQLEQLELGDLVQTSTDLAALRTLTRLTSLSLQLPELTAPICDELRAMKSLTQLSLFVSKASDATLVHLHALDCLHSLSVNGNISSAGVRHVKSFPNLERLWVNSAPIGTDD